MSVPPWERGQNTVPEGQSVVKLEPTPRTNYSIPRGENHIFGQLSARSVWLRGYVAQNKKYGTVHL